MFYLYRNYCFDIIPTSVSRISSQFSCVTPQYLINKIATEVTLNLLHVFFLRQRVYFENCIQIGHSIIG